MVSFWSKKLQRFWSICAALNFELRPFRINPSETPREPISAVAQLFLYLPQFTSELSVFSDHVHFFGKSGTKMYTFFIMLVLHAQKELEHNFWFVKKFALWIFVWFNFFEGSLSRKPVTRSNPTVSQLWFRGVLLMTGLDLVTGFLLSEPSKNINKIKVHGANFLANQKLCSNSFRSQRSDRTNMMKKCTVLIQISFEAKKCTWSLNTESC